jgi:hypothetical protein
MNSYLQSRFDPADAKVFLDEPGAIFLSTGNFADPDDFTFPEHHDVKKSTKNATSDVAHIWRVDNLQMVFHDMYARSGMGSYAFRARFCDRK